MDKKLVVYTALFGDYDNLLEPRGRYAGCDFVCFTDQESLKSKEWTLIAVENPGNKNIALNRKYKMLPHRYLDGYEQSIYVDANILITGNPRVLADKYLQKCDLVVPRHQARDCLYDEGRECIATMRSPLLETVRQMRYYSGQGYPRHFGLGDNSVILRNHKNPMVIKIMDDWWREFSTKTKRDQLSLGYALWKNGRNFQYMDESPVRENPFFEREPHKYDADKFSETSIGKVFKGAAKAAYKSVISPKFYCLPRSK